MSTSSDFENYGASYLISERNAERFIYENGPKMIGRCDGQFVIPSNQMDELLEKHPNDPRMWEQQLGLRENSLGDYPLRVDVYSPQDYNLREATSEMLGSNDKFVPDGKTSGGYDEAVIDPFPNPTLTNIENIGRVAPIEIDFESVKASSSNNDVFPDRRLSWPSEQSTSVGLREPQPEQIPSATVNNHEPTGCGPQTLSEINRNAEPASDNLTKPIDNAMDMTNSKSGGIK